MIDTVSERNALATRLKSIGMEVYLTILYPELKKDPNITWQEISRRYPRYNSLSILTQQSRFSNARSIIRHGWEKDALIMIVQSHASKDVIDLAQRLLKSMDIQTDHPILSDNQNSNLEKQNIQQTHPYTNREITSEIKQKSDIDTLTMLLKAIGKDIFITILYPEIKNNPNISWQEISDKYPRYSDFSINSQRGRWSHARSIFRNGWGNTALEIIAQSHASQNTTNLAKQYLQKSQYSIQGNNQNVPNASPRLSNKKSPNQTIEKQHFNNSTQNSVQTELKESTEPYHPNTKHIYIKEGQKGITYKSLFEDYLLGASEIIVEDPYIRQNHQLYNFIDFLLMIINLCEENETAKPDIHFYTWYDNLDQKDKSEYILRKIKKEAEVLGFNFSFGFRKFHDRSVKTNTGWHISLGRGLDIYQPYDRFSLIFQQQENRPCKEFHVAYIKETSEDKFENNNKLLVSDKNTNGF